MPEILFSVIAAVLTLMVFSYIFGDNALFKLAAHIFVGVAVGYALLVVWHQVFIPTLTSGHIVSVLPALFLCFLLIFKIRPAQGEVGNVLGSITLAFVLGVGVALAVGGALFGTLLPQVAATAGLSLNPNHYPNTETEVGLVQWLNNIIIILGTLGVFFYFTFAVRAYGFWGGLREGLVRFLAGMGRLVIIFTLGALFANTVNSRVALLISRLQFLADTANLLANFWGQGG
ncbi:MAG: hypothetical protein JW953_10175 [Anaerolineae bacterium]|nr:hypothetical protein [Anaerolineae bacterium]